MQTVQSYGLCLLCKPSVEMRDEEDVGGPRIRPSLVKPANKQLVHLLRKQKANSVAYLSPVALNSLEENVTPSLPVLSDNKTVDPKDKERFKNAKKNPIEGGITTLLKPPSVAKAKKSTSKVATGSAILDDPQAPLFESTFGDIILYNDEGKPYIDVNRLIYRPKERVKKDIKERFSWYFADYTFIISNFISLVCSSFILSLGVTGITWPTSIKSVNNGPDDPIILKVSKYNYGPQNFGAVLIFCAAFNGLNVLLGLFACIFGYKILLVQHIVLDILLLLLQFGTGGGILAKGRCDDADIISFQASFEGLIRVFAGPPEPRDAFEFVDGQTDEVYAASQLNDIQISMRCCGASNWTDYMSPAVLKDSIKTGSHGGTEGVFPFSCCKPWWIRNTHCAEGAHLWAQPGVDPKVTQMFRERIHQEGCVKTIWLACERLLYLSGYGVIFNALIHGILVALECFAVVLQIRSLNTMLRELKSLKEPMDERDAKAEGDGEDSISSISAQAAAIVANDKARITALSKRIKSLDQLKDIIALPTEDEIHFIKSRTAFAKFEMTTKNTGIGKTLNKARTSIFAPLGLGEELYPIEPKKVKSMPIKLIPLTPPPPPKVDEEMDNLITEITESSLRHYGKKKKKSKKRLHKKKKKIITTTITTTTFVNVKGHLHVPSHRIKKKKSKKKVKKVRSSVTSVDEDDDVNKEEHDEESKHKKKTKKHKKKDHNVVSEEDEDSSSESESPKPSTSSVKKKKKLRRKPKPKKSETDQ